ncbi:hypothetical protein STEG23_032246, partial [Scotinomys teguina]
SGSLTVSSWEKLGHNLDFAAEQGTLKSRVRPIWMLVRSCLDQRCHEAVENGQAALEILQEERSEKAASERENKDRKRKQGLYPDLTEFRDSDEERNAMDDLNRKIHEIEDEFERYIYKSQTQIEQKYDVSVYYKISGLLHVTFMCCFSVTTKLAYLKPAKLELGNGDPLQLSSHHLP